MGDTCPYLEYRPLSDADDGGGDGDHGGGSDGGGGGADGEPRAYCEAADRFVQAMRADICNGRYGLDHETDCEFYRDAEGLPEAVGSEGAADEAQVRGTDDGADRDAGDGVDRDAGGD